MSHSYICRLVHTVFSTAGRRPLIRVEIQNRLHAYMGGIARENEMAALAVGGVADHVDKVETALRQPYSPSEPVLR